MIAQSFYVASSRQYDPDSQFYLFRLFPILRPFATLRSTFNLFNVSSSPYSPMVLLKSYSSVFRPELVSSILIFVCQIPYLYTLMTIFFCLSLILYSADFPPLPPLYPTCAGVGLGKKLDVYYCRPANTINIYINTHATQFHNMWTCDRIERASNGVISVGSFELFSRQFSDFSPSFKGKKVASVRLSESDKKIIIKC